MSSIYWNILSNVKDVLVALPGFALPQYPRTTFEIRRKPFWLDKVDGPQACVIAPREDLSEKLDQLTFANGAFLIFEVYIGLSVLGEWTVDSLQWRLDRREEIRLKFWNPTILQSFAGLLGEFDVDYDPSPGVSDGIGEKRIASWQRFDFKVSTTRQNP